MTRQTAASAPLEHESSDVSALPAAEVARFVQLRDLDVRTERRLPLRELVAMAAVIVVVAVSLLQPGFASSAPAALGSGAAAALGEAGWPTAAPSSGTSGAAPTPGVTPAPTPQVASHRGTRPMKPATIRSLTRCRAAAAHPARPARLVRPRRQPLAGCVGIA
jgi:hypothetical protein